MAARTGHEAIKRPIEPRIPPIDLASMTDNQRILAGIGASTVVRTLLRREDLFTPWVTLGTKLLSGGQLSPRDRELAILRVALRTECEYEWANHAAGALAGGATAEEITALSDESASWPAADAALLAAVDGLCSQDCVSDDTWASLSATRDNGEIIEFLLVIGYYRMNAGILNSIGVQPEPGRPHLAKLPDPAPRPQPPTTTTGPQTNTTRRATTAGERAPLDGTWEITFHHPAGNQQLTLEMHTSDGQISGSVTNRSLGVTVQILDGILDGDRIRCKTIMTTPLQVEIDWDGIVDGDAITGNVTITGGGTFPFEGAHV